VILARDGPNVITAPLEPPTWVRFAKNLFGGFSLLLWLGALLSFAHYSIETGIQAEAASENLVLGRWMKIDNSDDLDLKGLSHEIYLAFDDIHGQF
jgi:hypothetical protein